VDLDIKAQMEHVSVITATGEQIANQHVLMELWNLVIIMVPVTLVEIASVMVIGD
jgi:hypothetical protein